MGSLNRQFDFDWVDAFSQEPFCGNGCAVVYDDGILSDQERVYQKTDQGRLEQDRKATNWSKVGGCEQRRRFLTKLSKSARCQGLQKKR